MTLLTLHLLFFLLHKGLVDITINFYMCMLLYLIKSYFLTVFQRLVSLIILYDFFKYVTVIS